jgi:CheY-like chemotaxis protein
MGDSVRGGGSVGRKPTLLTVDDDPAITDFLRWVLHAEYDVTACAGVVEALSAVERWTPDAVVTDLDMDDGGGKHLLAVLADSFPAVRRVVFSAAPTGDLLLLLRSGLAHAAVSKSDELAVLVSALERLLRTQETAPLSADSVATEDVR